MRHADYQPRTDFARGLYFYGAFCVAACLVWLFAPKLAVMVLGFGSLAGAEHVYRVRVYATERRWRLLATAALGAIAAIFVLAAALVNLGAGR